MPARCDTFPTLRECAWRPHHCPQPAALGEEYCTYHLKVAAGLIADHRPVFTRDGAGG